MNNLSLFFNLIADQFKYGGKKYAQTETKEATDCLFDDFGKNWLFGTMAKYCFRYSNLARERDLLKIACYIFILWLKRGFHLEEYGTEEIINTTVEIKEKYFNKFKTKTNNFYSSYNYCGDDAITVIYNSLYRFGEVEFQAIVEDRLFEIFILSYIIWNNNTKNKGQDCDTWNEQKK